MTVVAFYILNIIQGVTEFLPISSSGHLIIAEWLYNISQHGLEAFLHLPTALAILFVFWQAYLLILKDKKKWPIILAAIIPAGVIGLFFGDAIDAVFYSPIVVSLTQIIWGVVMFYVASTYKPTPQNSRSWKDLTWVESLKIGFAQILALIPGTSRSGITTLAGMSQGLAPQESASFSFIAGFPLIAAASGVGLIKLAKTGDLFTTVAPTVIIGGLLVSFILGIIFIKLFTSKHTLTVMKFSSIYRIIVGLLILLWLT